MTTVCTRIFKSKAKTTSKTSSSSKCKHCNSIKHTTKNCPTTQTVATSTAATPVNQGGYTLGATQGSDAGLGRPQGYGG